MKTVFRSEEIAHIWAHSLAPRGRSPGNLSFEGDAISSYATVIGRRIRHKGITAYVLDRASFSISTSKSQGRVARAIPDSAPVFPIWSGQRVSWAEIDAFAARQGWVKGESGKGGAS